MAAPGTRRCRCLAGTRSFSARNSGVCEPLDHVLLDAPGHRADEPFRRRRGVRRADLQNLRHQRRIIGDPVSHHDPTAGPCHANHLLRDIERSRREHRPEDADDEVEAVVLELVQVRCVAFLEPELVRPRASARLFPASTRLLAMSTPSTSAPRLAAGTAVVPSPHPRSKTSSPGVISRLSTSASPLSRMLSAMRVKSPFSHNALFGFTDSSLSSAFTDVSTTTCARAETVSANPGQGAKQGQAWQPHAG